jgi:hypothetical protein
MDLYSILLWFMLITYTALILYHASSFMEDS